MKSRFTAPDPLPTAYAFVNTGEAAPQSYVLRMGDPHQQARSRSIRPCHVVAPGELRDSRRPPRGAAPRSRIGLHPRTTL